MRLGALIHGFPAPPAATAGGALPVLRSAREAPIATLAGTAAGGNKESTP